MARTKLGERLSFLARQREKGAGAAAGPASAAEAGAMHPAQAQAQAHGAQGPAPAEDKAPAAEGAADVGDEQESCGRKRAAPVQRYKPHSTLRLYAGRKKAQSGPAPFLLKAGSVQRPLFKPKARLVIKPKSAAEKAGAFSPSADKAVPVEEPVSGRELVGTQFFVRGSWWKGATYMERKSLYPVKCVAYDEAHTFATRKRKPDLSWAVRETKAGAIRFELTRAQDQAWNTGQLWMMLSQYTEFARKYDADLLVKAKEEPKEPVMETASASLTPALYGNIAGGSAAAAAGSSHDAPTNFALVVTMPDSYSRCSNCAERHRGRISCWKTCGSIKMRRKLAARQVPTQPAAPRSPTKPAAAPLVKDWAPPGPTNKKAQASYDVAKQLLKSPSIFRGKLLTTAARINWLSEFAAALDGDNARLARLLVMLEQNLPWRAVSEEFGPNREGFLRQLKAVAGYNLE